MHAGQVDGRKSTERGGWWHQLGGHARDFSMSASRSLAASFSGGIRPTVAASGPRHTSEPGAVPSKVVGGCAQPQKSTVRVPVREVGHYSEHEYELFLEQVCSMYLLARSCVGGRHGPAAA
jgi:hypothetical protein